MPPGAEVEVEGALDQVEVTGEELRLLCEPDGGLRRHVDPVVAGPGRHVGHRPGALHVEHVAARPEREVERLEAVVGDAVAAAAVGGRSGGAEGVEPDPHRVRRVGVDLTAEPDEVGAADQPDVDAVGAPGGAGGAAGHRDTGVGAEGLREEEQLQRRANLLGGGADVEGHGTDAGGDATDDLRQHDGELRGTRPRRDGEELVERSRPVQLVDAAGPGGHAEAGDGALGDGAEVGAEVRRVVQPRGVGAGAAVEDEQGPQQVEQPGLRAHPEGVVTRTAEDPRVALDGPDVDACRRRVRRRWSSSRGASSRP